MMQPGMQQPMMPAQHPMQPPPVSMHSRGGYNAPQFGPPRPPGYAAYGQAQHAGYRGPPPSNVGPMAHQMFHNAARMARHVPHRTDTPMTDVPSSDPASSSSAPDSSNPPTPKDHTTIQVVVDPAFINPDLVDLPDSSSEPVLPAKYFDYADGLEKPIYEPDMEVPHPSVPPSGFVQRVKAMLESKAAAEAAAKREHDKGNRPEQSLLTIDADQDREDISELMELHELAANETPRFTIIEEFEAPVELPASPVKLPELEAIEPSQRHSESQRLTREMVKAELGPSSPDNTQAQLDDTTTRLILGMNHGLDIPKPQPAHLVEETIQEADTGSEQSRPSHEKRRHESVAETVATESVAPSLPTAADYAVHFSGPMDTTVASDETQSQNPFALDADTITIQQTKDASKERLQDIKESVTPEPPQDSELLDGMESTPVSPLRPGEIVKRSSAVSPIQTEVTLGIDETLRLANDDKTETASVSAESNTESSQPTESMPPPTPRTPKTYSKSVQLRPSMTITDSNSTGTNRFSLPGDLSTVGDTTLNSASDMVTDIAVRFSLPQTTITIGKPQIVDVSTSSTPDKAKQDAICGQPSSQLADLKAARRSSVTFADEIAPLNISKKPEHHRPLQGAEASMAKGKSIIRRSSPRDDIEFGRSSRDNTMDMRFTASNNLIGINSRFGSTHLPGLKEESIEDMSISEHKRISGGGDQFPLPARIAAVKAMQERRLQESADKAKARRQARQHNRPLADSRDLPSLNFSRTDLIDRLNEALEVRSATSMEVIRRRDFTGIHCPSPQRPLSTEPLRERYTSFFSKPEDFTFFDEPNDSDDELELEHEKEPENDKALVPTLQIQEQTEIEGVEPEKRPLSPEDFLNVATQVQRLSIPNVNGLSDRLSELIPGLRNLSNLQLDHIFAGSRESLRRSLELGRPDTMMTARTSAGFRTLAERAEEIVKNGTHDSVAPRGLSLNNDLPPLPESTSVDQISAGTSSEARQGYLSGSMSAPTDLGKDPSRPTSALLRARAPTTEEEVQQLLPKEMNPITRNARRSIITSQHTSRPWNQDENYPWASKIEIDLSVPSQAHTRNSFASEVLRERRTKSLDLNQPIDPDDTTKGIDIGSLIDTRLERSVSVTTEQATGISPQHTRRISKRSIIGSISRKFGLSGKTANDEDTTTRSLPSRSPLPHRASTQQSHKPGDRYPTSGLTPPAGFNLDEVRSFFSDNSSERDRTASFRKRLTNFKGKGKSNVRSSEPVRHSIDATNTAYDGGSLVEARLGTESRAHTYDGVGMSKTEFHIKRFGEKLRHLFARGGELIRSFSARGKGRKPERGQDEWLADSLYSGV